MSEEKDQPVYVYVNSMFKQGKLVTSEEDTQEQIAVVKINPEGAYMDIETSRRVTVNTGNYSSATFSVACSVPCPLEDGQIQQGYEFISDLCESKLAEKVREVNGG